MKNLDHQKAELLEAIHQLGYDSLRYSIFSKERPGEWEVVIEYDDTSGVYLVYGTMDRGSYHGKTAYRKFNAAKEGFMTFLEDIVMINKYYVEEGMPINYDSPLWSNN
ncbi:hypothetical protein N594_01660 [Streptococcus equi subsp. zooepidemicus Sz16]|uniref:Imm59 family immunity protein n=1 Tax=Streptococcus equi TaxID=1336 RepID=UPI0005BD7E2B|nr:Imm59 family immunity protein [Streptococcus equi]KIS09851.1 hypothetical protein N594_01660 [Streptococcus equi subsp. zooepidemicus Sz16]KIS20580.1 hypothetical protein AT49_01550 [Streptococcus equi subsp. zooepidemicus SzAM35]MDI5945642.1 Imm59 family immunity protein [Streptococcus equi subsp. zooepidemicus]VTP90943.1 Uncharacterised protein [Streptococcus equi subsp. zooepidemicus]HEK9996767.1 hypothetical protein [Streptococcus equi subsp. zooepidemicus]